MVFLDQTFSSFSNYTKNKIASGEISAVLPFPSIQQVLEDVEPVEEVVSAEEQIEQKNLHYHVAQVKHLIIQI